jgi:hypothetical protein
MDHEERNKCTEDCLEQLLDVINKAINDNIADIFNPTKYSLEKVLTAVVTVLISAIIEPLTHMKRIEHITMAKQMLLRLAAEADKKLNAIATENECNILWN